MPVRHDDPRPPYQQLADELRHAIQSGAYKAGDRLPSTMKLAQANGIAPMTARRAILLLQEEGLALGQQGRAVFVLGPKPQGQHPATDEQPATADTATRDSRMSRQRGGSVPSDTTDTDQATPPAPDGAPASMEEARRMLAELNERLDQIEAQQTVASQPPDLGLAPEIDADIDL